jgi:hypothetical protein
MSEGNGIANPPGRAEIAYRVGDQQTLFEAAVARLPQQRIPDGPNAGTRPLQALTTRAPEDWTIALLYAWAAVGDILTFYSERIANEGFLGTATERRSAVELAGLVGYVPKPGLSASADLAFTVTSEQGDAVLTLASGLEVQSVPDAEQQPQSFETTQEIVAHSAWNALRPLQTEPQLLNAGSRSLYLDGTATGLSPGDTILLLQASSAPGAAPFWLLRTLDAVEPEPTGEIERTRISWPAPLGPLPEPASLTVIAFRVSAPLFGNDAPDWKTQPYEIKLAAVPPGFAPQDFSDWPGFAVNPSKLDLDAVYAEIMASSWMVLAQPTELTLATVGVARTVTLSAFALSSQVTELIPETVATLAFQTALSPPRGGLSATLLADGRVLLAGGRDGDGAAVNVVEIYDPKKRTVTAAGSLAVARWDHTAVLVGDGSVLIAGGEDASGPLAAAELFRLGGPTPLTPLPLPPMASARTEHRATALPDGRVLVSGGRDATATLGTAELFDPRSATFLPPIAMTTPRRDHSATLLVVAGDVRVLVAGGEDANAVLSTAETFVVASGSFVAVTAAMTTKRTRHAAVLLTASGGVLLSGGRDAANVASSPSAEIFTPATDPAGGGFAATGGAMVTPRWGHHATALQNGQVLIANGADATEPALDLAECYDPAAGSFRSAVASAVPRIGGAASLLGDATVLLAGGRNGSGVLSDAERYDPRVETFVATGAMKAASFGAAGALLPNGYLLLTGGWGFAVQVPQPAAPPVGPLSTTRLYDPLTGLFSETGQMGTARAWHTATTLGNGSVLVAGGQLAEVDPELQAIIDMLNALAATVGQLQPLINDIVNDANSGIGAMQQFETWMTNNSTTGEIRIDFDLGWWASISGSYSYSPSTLGITVLCGGPPGVPPAGNDDDPSPWIWSWSVDYWDLLAPWIQQYFQSSNAPGIPYWFQQILNVASQGQAPTLDSLVTEILAAIQAIIDAIVALGAGWLTAEVYDPATGAFAQTNAQMIVPRLNHTATLLPTGQVLLCGGWPCIIPATGPGPTTSGSPVQATAELFDANAGDFALTAGALTTGRAEHTATLLANGLVLVAGGTDGTNALASAELYDPATGQFASIGALGFARYGHSATLLGDGRVLIAGGVDSNGQSLPVCELFYPAWSGFGPAASLAPAVAWHVASLLDDGRVLIAGGVAGQTVQAAAQIYDPVSGDIRPTGALPVPRAYAVAVRLGTGPVLVAGGADDANNDPLSSSVLYMAPPLPPPAGDRRDSTVLAASEALPLAPDPMTAPVMDGVVILDSGVPDLVPGQTLILTGTPLLAMVPGEILPPLRLRDPVSGRSQPLAPKEPLTIVAVGQPDSKGLRSWTLTTPTGFTGAIIAPLSTFELLPDPAAPIAAERLVLAAAETPPDDKRTRLTFAQPLRRIYQRSTVTLNANIVPAVQTRTVGNEILGSGDGALAHQNFALAAAPVSAFAAATPSGWRNALQVELDGVRWDPVDSFIDAGPESRVFTVQRDQAGQARVSFGDGRRGARLPTGDDNVVATYGVGLGSGGNVPSGRLVQLPNPPERIDAVTNPLAASGGTDPEPLEALRGNIPTSVVSLGRIVDLTDFETFALGFAGIDKAQSALLPGSNGRIVCLTVAGPDGALVPPESELWRNLAAAIAAATEPGIGCILLSYTPKVFALGARLVLDPRRHGAGILAQARARLLDRFGFGASAFGGGVAASSVVTCLQETPGVEGVVLVRFDFGGEPAQIRSWLGAAGLSVDTGRITPPEVLTIDPARISLEEQRA